MAGSPHETAPIQETAKKPSVYLRNAAIIKIFSIGVLLLVLLIPASMTGSLIRERESRRDAVVAEISSKWGESQVITGPFISVPYREYYTDAKGLLQFQLRYLHILPEKLAVSGALSPEIRYRSLYEAVLYRASLDFEGTFRMPDPSRLSVKQEDILWDESFFSIGITDLRGVQEKIVIRMDGEEYACHPGLKTRDLAASGVGAYAGGIPVAGERSFSFSISLNGSGALNFIPVGESNTVHLQSTWPAPSFQGAFLPASRDVTDHGFSADWKVLHLNRSYPQYWTGNEYSLDSSAFGLRLILTADIYQKATRISKYAIVFIVFTFSAFFFSEILTGRKMHPIQYLLVGLAILLFYTLLLSLSEYIHFNHAYILSAAAIMAVITGYVYGITQDRKFAAVISGVLFILYAYLFVVLQLEDYALIMGSVGMLIVLAAVMYITRKIDWYSVES